jgi:hypothetical protein
VGVVDIGGARQSLAIGDLRRADQEFYPVDALELIEFRLEIGLADSHDDQFAGFRVLRVSEVGIVQRHLIERGRKPLGIARKLRFDLDAQNQLGVQSVDHDLDP